MADAALDQLPLPIEIIFSCSICQATAPEIYANGDQGSHDGSGVIQAHSTTKLWLTECTHLTCTKHLEGGGVPYYKPGDNPKAACPLCTTEKGDTRKKTLYGIRGCLEGTYHPQIHSSWFETPPINLDGSGKGMEALRFHYVSLVRFGTAVALKLREAHAAAEIAQSKASEEASSRHRFETEAVHLRVRVKELEQCEKDLKPWKERQTKIEFYLKVFEEVTRENEKLREQLTAMGYAVPKRKYFLADPDTEGVRDRTHKGHSQDQSSTNKPNAETTMHQSPKHILGVSQHNHVQSSPDHTASRPAEPVINLHSAAPANAGALKRKRLGEDVTQDEATRRTPRLVRNEPRHMLPHPLHNFDRARHNVVEHQTQPSTAQSRPPFLATPAMIHRSGNPNAEGTPMSTLNQPWPRGSPTRNDEYAQTSRRFPEFPAPSRHEAFLEDRHQVNRDSFAANIQRFSKDGRWPVDSRESQQQPGLHENYNPPDSRSGFRQQNDHQHGGYDQSSHFLQPTRIPLQQSTQTAVNIQRPDHLRLEEQRSFSSPIRRYGTSQRTPSPVKQRFLPEQEPVSSPFFRKTGAVQHTGRVTLPSRSGATPSIQQQRLNMRSPASRMQNFATDAFRMPPPAIPTASRTHPNVSRGLHPSATNTPRIQHQELYPRYDLANPFPTPSSPLSSRSKALAPSTPRNAQGLFQRFDEQAPPPQYGTPFHHDTRDQFSAYRHVPPPLPQYHQNPTTPNNMYLAQPSTLYNQPPSAPSNPYTENGARNNNNNIYTFDGHTFGTPAPGAKSGVSRPSREWAREAGGGELGARRSVRR